jgi:hypothetical protein
VTHGAPAAIAQVLTPQQPGTGRFFMQARHPRTTLLAATALCLALMLVQGCGGGEPKARADSAAAASAESDVDRFDVRPVATKRGPGLLLRTDTATGQAWTMGVMDAAKWNPLREGEAGVPSPDGSASGRYTIRAISHSRGAPTLVRTDHATGRIWRKGASSQGPWVLVPNPDPSALSEPEPEAGSEPAATRRPPVEAPEELDSDSDSNPDADPTGEAAAL